jgi:hypothetical protein
MADLDRSRRPNGSSTTRWLRRRRLRPPDDVQRDGLVGVAAETFDFEVMVAGVERIAEGRGRLRWTLVAQHALVQATHAKRSASLRASLARSAEARIELP